MQQSRRPWTYQVLFLILKQDKAVMQIVEEVGLKNWPLVSTIMRQRFSINGRSGKQCRQRWHNQLNPEVNKKPWSEEEEKLLFQAHKTFKNRWIDISKLFEGRTDNSIKNHFYSTIRRSLRRICKLLGNRNSTSELRNIKPSILSKIFEYSELRGDQVTQQNQHIVQQSKVITEELLNFARSKPTGETIHETKRKTLQSLIDKLNEFSKNYNTQKDSFCQHINSLSTKTPTIIIFQSQPTSSKSSPISKKTNKNKILKDEFYSEEKIKVSTYDWDEFQKRCMFVKQVFENQTESNRAQSGSQDIEEISYQWKPYCFDQKMLISGETCYTPLKSGINKGFQPFKEMSQGTQAKNIEEQQIMESRKIEFETFAC